MGARLEKFSEEEKKELASIFKRKFFAIAGIYLLIMLLSIAAITYFNLYSEQYYIQNNLEVINVVFVVITALCGRLLIAECRDYLKEINSSDKKVIETKIIGKKNNEIILGNKLFEEDDFLLHAVDFDLLNVGDSVRIELSAKSDSLFSIKKLHLP